MKIWVLVLEIELLQEFRKKNQHSSVTYWAIDTKIIPQPYQGLFESKVG